METIYTQFQHFFHPFSLILLLFVILFYKYYFTSYPSTAKNLPPSPPKLPIIGNLHQLGLLPHRSLRSLSRHYGKLMLLYMGSKPALVVSTADGAREIMKTHDLIFCNRPKLRSASCLFYGGKDVAFGPYGEQWRHIKSIFVTQLLSNKKVVSFRGIREEEVAIMAEKISKFCSSAMNFSDIVLTFTFDVICRASFGRKYNENEGGINLKNCMDEAMRLLGEFFVGDFVPSLSWIDRVNGKEGRLQKVAAQLDEFLEKVIGEHQVHLKTQKNNCFDELDRGRNDSNFMDILLEDDIPLESIKANVLDMFLGGTDTTYSLVEWVTVELIRHPRVMKELQEEVRKIVGGKGCRVRENDVERMKYLKAVIKETLRLHPPGPLLVFRESIQDIEINGFDVAAGTIVIINAWAIQTDSTLWKEPEEFRPERFLYENSSIDFKGQDFQFIPFGAGRRGCPGASFAVVNAELVIATLMNEFDLMLPGGMQSEILDMTEIAGLTVRRRDPLMLIATPHAF